MLCEICSGEMELVVLLPLKQDNGNIETMACLKCAEASGTYCEVHEVPHLGFHDETTACRRCIEEMVAENQFRVSSLVTALLGIAGKVEYVRLVEAAIDSSYVTGSVEEISVLYFLATKAARMRVTLDSVMELIETSRSISHLLE